MSSVGLMGGCASSLQKFPFDNQVNIGEMGLEIQFYGVGCFRISYRGIDVLSDPFFSYLPFRQVAFGKIKSDPKQVDPYVEQLKNVQLVVVGHNHYDHNLDLDYITPHLHEKAIIVGSKTMKHTFAPNLLERDIIDVNSYVTSHSKMGQWFEHPSGKIRILPILSEHPNQYLFFHLFTKSLTKDRDSIPSRAHHYQEGLTFAFLIDFLGNHKKIQRRIYLQTTSTGFPKGFFPAEVLEEHPVDVALLSMDCANLSMSGKYSILDFVPSPYVFFCHYENFFRSKDKIPKEIVKVDLSQSRAFFKNTSQTRYFFPAFDSTFHL